MPAVRWYDWIVEDSCEIALKEYIPPSLEPKIVYPVAGFVHKYRYFPHVSPVPPDLGAKELIYSPYLINEVCREYYNYSPVPPIPNQDSIRITGLNYCGENVIWRVEDTRKRSPEFSPPDYLLNAQYNEYIDFMLLLNSMKNTPFDITIHFRVYSNKIYPYWQASTARFFPGNPEFANFAYDVGEKADYFQWVEDIVAEMEGV